MDDLHTVLELKRQEWADQGIGDVRWTLSDEFSPGQFHFRVNRGGVQRMHGGRQWKGSGGIL